MQKSFKFQFQTALLVISFLLLYVVCFSQTKQTPTFAKHNTASTSVKVQCTAITNKGYQCSRSINVAINKQYCTQHYNISLKYKKN